MIRIDEPDIMLANDIENRNSEAILLNAQLNIDIIQNRVNIFLCYFNPSSTAIACLCVCECLFVC